MDGQSMIRAKKKIVHIQPAAFQLGRLFRQPGDTHMIKTIKSRYAADGLTCLSVYEATAFSLPHVPLIHPLHLVASTAPSLRSDTVAPYL